MIINLFIKIPINLNIQFLKGIHKILINTKNILLIQLFSNYNILKNFFEELAKKN